MRFIGGGGVAHWRGTFEGDMRFIGGELNDPQGGMLYTS